MIPDSAIAIIEQFQSSLTRGLLIGFAVSAPVAIVVLRRAWIDMRRTILPHRYEHSAAGALHPRKRRWKELVDRREKISRQLPGGVLPGGLVIGREGRERLTAEKALIDAELTHLRLHPDGAGEAITGPLEGMSRGALAGTRLRLRRQREKTLTALDNGEMKPGPELRRELFAMGDEIMAIDEKLGGFGSKSDGLPDPEPRLRLNDITATHDKVSARWGEWHTDFGLLTEFPAIHDVQHEAFARRIIDAHEAAREARDKAEAHPRDPRAIERFAEAVNEFVAALDDGEHKARLIARGPALDPVLDRIMETAETLLAKIHAYQAGDSAVSWGECQVAADGLVKLLRPVIGHQAEAIPELEATIARELEAARG